MRGSPSDSAPFRHAGDAGGGAHETLPLATKSSTKKVGEISVVAFARIQLINSGAVSRKL